MFKNSHAIGKCKVIRGSRFRALSILSKLHTHPAVLQSSQYLLNNNQIGAGSLLTSTCLDHRCFHLDTSVKDDCARASSPHLLTQPPLQGCDISRLDPTATNGNVSHESKSRAYYAYQIASHLPGDLLLKADSAWTEKQLHNYGARKEHKSMVNTQLKDMGPMSHDWRQPFERLKMYTVPEEVGVAKEPRPNLRGILSKSRRTGLQKATRPPAMPESWTCHNFALYVEELTTLKPARPLAIRSMSSTSLFPEPFTREGVLDVLEQLVHSPETRKYLTVELCNLVLQYFYDKSMMNRARALYIRMEHLEMDIYTPTFNILLRGSAAHHDLRNFTFLLDNMIKRGMRPNATTWTAFLMTVESKEVRQIIVNEIFNRGLMSSNPRSKKEVIPLLVKSEISNHLNANQDLSTFFGHMSKKYGNDWLSTSVGNVMLSEVGRLVSTAESLGLLREMRHHAFAVNEVTMNEMLNQSSRLGNLDLAIEIINIFDQHWGLKPQRVAHQTLFLQAWKCQRLNLARAVWVSACLQGCVTFEMQNHVMRSILSTIPKDIAAPGADVNTEEDVRRLSRARSFKLTAGQFILGLGLVQAQKDLDLGEPVLSPSSVLPCRQLQVKGARLALENNLATVAQGRLRQRLSDVLRDALSLDRQWDAEGVESVLSLSWKIQHGLPVDIEIVTEDDRDTELTGPKEKLLAASRLRTKLRDFETSILSPLPFQDLARLARKPRNELTFRFGPRQTKPKSRLNPSRRRAQKRKNENLTDD